MVVPKKVRKFIFWWVLLKLWGLTVSFFQGFWEELFPPKKTNSGTYGTAKFSEVDELKRLGHVDGKGFLLGYLDGYPITSLPDASLVMIAKKGYGKSLTLEAMIRRPSSADKLIVDASGSIYERRKGELEGMGYKVVCINLVNPKKGVGYNPMTFFKHSDPDFGLGRDVQTFGHLHVGSEKDGKHWLEIARILFNGFVRGDVKATPEVKLGSVSAISNMLAASSYEEIGAHFAKLRRLKDHQIDAAYSALDKVEARERGSFFSTMVRKFEPWRDDALAYLSSGDSWCWEDVFASPQKTAVFVITGLDHKEIVAPYTRVIVGLAVASAGRWYSTHGKLAKGLDVLVDEGDLLGDCQPISDAITKQRKVGVNVCLAYQSLSQLNRNMTDAKSILDNSDLWLTGGLNDDELLKRVSFLMGQRTITTKSRSGDNENEREEGQPLITADQLRDLSIDEVAALLGTTKAKLEKAYSVVNGEARFK